MIFLEFYWVFLTVFMLAGMSTFDNRYYGAPGLSIYQHGIDVAKWYACLYDLLTSKKIDEECHFSFNDVELALLSELISLSMTPDEAKMYQILHDCGKPDCLTFDDLGRRHFPNHAEISYETFKAIFPEDTRSANLIRYDMLCHTTKGNDIETLKSLTDASTLLLTAWAELHANANALFGGYESTSFKIKRKGLMKLTKKLLKK